MAGIIRIPDEAFGAQRLRPLPSVFLPTPRTTDADFGGDIGRALTSAGDALGERALEAAARRNEAAARDIDNRFAGELRQTLHDPERGYFAGKGRAALDARDATHQGVSDLYDRHLAMAANPAQRQMARATLDRRRALAHQGIDAHAAAQDAQWQDETRAARIDGAIADGVLAWREPAQLRLHYNTGLQEAQAGGDAAQAGAASRDYAGRFHAAVIGARIDADPGGARQYFEQNRAAIDPAAAAALDARLTLAGERRLALDIAERAAPRRDAMEAAEPGPGREPRRDDYVDSSRAAAEALPDASPSLISMAEAAAARRHARDHAAWTQRRGEAINAAYAWIDANPDAAAAEMPIDVWMGLDRDTQARIEGYVNAGGEVETDWQRYFDLQDLAIENPGTFADVNLVEERPDIADRDLEELGDLQEIIRNGDPDNELVRLRAVKDVFDDYLHDAEADADLDDEFPYVLRRRFQEELAAFSQKGGERPDEPDTRRLLDRLATRTSRLLHRRNNDSRNSGPHEQRDGDVNAAATGQSVSGSADSPAGRFLDIADDADSPTDPGFERITCPPPDPGDTGPCGRGRRLGPGGGGRLPDSRASGTPESAKPSQPAAPQAPNRPMEAEGIGKPSGPATPQNNATGQTHHPISRPVFNELENHPNLKGLYTPRDPRFTTQARDLDAHKGYDRFHRDLDREIVEWLRSNQKATPSEFENYLRNLYSRPDVRSRFPNGLDNP